MKGSALTEEKSQLKAEVQLLHGQQQEAARKACDAASLAAEQMRALQEHKVKPETEPSLVCPLFVLATAPFWLTRHVNL